MTDILDGYVARKWNGASKLGGLFDTFVDKAFAAVLLLKLNISGLLPSMYLAIVLVEYLAVPIIGVLYSKRYFDYPKPSKVAKASNFAVILTIIVGFAFNNLLLVSYLIVITISLNAWHIVGRLIEVFRRNKVSNS